MGYSCEYHRTTKAQIDAYVKSINPNYAEVVGVTGAWVKFIVKLTNKPCADLLLMHKDKEGYVWYKAISASSGPNVTNQSVARWLKKEYAARGLTPSDDLQKWLDDCDNDGEIRDYDDFVYEELIYDNDNYEYVECANYDFSESIEDKLLVIWQWETHVGYCRKFLGLRLGEYGETVKNCLKADACYRRQVDVLDDANVTDESELYELLFGQYTSWKWNNPRAVERAIEEWCGMYNENKED